MKMESKTVGPEKVTRKLWTRENRKERRAGDVPGVPQPLEVVWKGGAGRDGGQASQVDK